MSMLEGFPMVDQRTAVTTDNLPSENANDDCVAASICAAVMYLKGISRVGGIFTPDNFKDKADGQGYVGFTAAIQYVNFCQSLGVKLWSVDGDSSSLVRQAHQFLAQGKPVIFTQDDWVVDTSLDKYKGWTHVAAWYRDDTPGALTSMDPWGGFSRMKSDAGWVQVLRDNQIWIAERLEETVRIDITTPGVGYFFEALSDHQWKCKQTSHVLQYAILDFYKGYSNADLCGLTWLGLPKTDEVPIEKLSPAFAHFAGHGIVVQFLECGVACYDPGHLVDQRPGSKSSVYLLQLYNGGPGQDPGIAKLQATVADLTAANNMQAQKITDLQHGQAVDPLASQALAVVRQIKPLVQSF